jgi:glycosyltransferase involved in cell wall biosynthesis
MADRRTAASTDGQPVLSVLLPCWNAEATIEVAIGSVLETQVVPLECIVVDDASTDGTAAIVARLAAADSRVILIRQPANEGVSSARNRGLGAVRGTWLTMLDADDRFVPGGLEILARAALATGARAVVGQQVWFDGHERWLSELYDIPDIREPGRKSLATNPGLLYFVSPHAKLFHRSIIEGLRFSGRVLGDQPWVIRALLRAADEIEVLADTVYEWYRSADGGSITATTRSSARRGVEAAQVAGEALRAVTEEADTHLDAASRNLVLTRYVERILRSDLGVHLANALGRTDPTIAELLDAIRGFVAGTPAGYLRGSDALARDILEPVLRRWRRVGSAGRAAYWRLFDAALRKDPGAARGASSGTARLALRIAGWPPRLVARPAGAWLLAIGNFVTARRRRLAGGPPATPAARSRV